MIWPPIKIALINFKVKFKIFSEPKYFFCLYTIYISSTSNDNPCDVSHSFPTSFVKYHTVYHASNFSIITDFKPWLPGNISSFPANHMMMWRKKGTFTLVLQSYDPYPGFFIYLLSLPPWVALKYCYCRILNFL